MQNSKLTESVTILWSNFSKALGVIVVAPYKLEQDGISVNCVAYFPHYGKPNGMVVGAYNAPKDQIDLIKKLANGKNLYCSFINLESYLKGEIKALKEALEDWGYYGPQDQCPEWFNGFKGGNALP